MPLEKKVVCEMPYPFYHASDSVLSLSTPVRQQAEKKRCRSEKIQIGYVNATRYLLTLSATFLLCGSFLLAMPQAAFAYALQNSGPFTTTASKFVATNFRLDRSVLSQGGSLADAVVIDATVTNLVLTKTVFIPTVGNVTFKFTTTSNQPAVFLGLRAHIVSFSASQGSFPSLDLTGRLVPFLSSTSTPAIPITVAPTRTATPIQATPTISNTPTILDSSIATPIVLNADTSPITTTPVAASTDARPISTPFALSNSPTPASTGVDSHPIITPDPAILDAIRNITITVTNVTIMTTFLSANMVTVPDLLLTVR